MARRRLLNLGDSHMAPAPTASKTPLLDRRDRRSPACQGAGASTKVDREGLAALAAETGLEISVCHLPPGTSKWNKIEHRLFSQITRNWRGRPLNSLATIINLIGSTTTSTGLTVTAHLDTADYPTGIKISDEDMKNLPITRDAWHGDWNYCVHPRRDTPEPP